MIRREFPHRILHRIHLSMLVFIVTACGSPGSAVLTPPPGSGAVAAIVLTPGTASLNIGGNTTLSAVARDAAGLVVTTTLTWHSSQASVATVDAAGKVTAVAEGSTNITATSGTIVSNASVVTVTLSSTTTALVTPVGTPTGVAVSQSIGPTGGSLPSADGRLTVIVPAGAVASATTFTIQPVTNQAPGGIGDAYQLLPDGLTFPVPVQLAFHYTTDEMAGVPSDGLSVGYQDVQRYWRTIFAGAYDAASRTLTVPTNHFTVFSGFAGVQLKPGSTSARIGTTVLLTAVDCSPVSASDPRRNACTTANFTVNTWAVNSTPGGTSTYGTVVGGSLSATYTAPAARPSLNPVAVSVNVDAGLRSGARGTLQLVSNILIYEDSWTGTSSSVQFIFSASAQIKWVLFSSLNGVSTYRATGTVTAGQSGCTITPSTVPIDANTAATLIVDYNAIPATYSGGGSQGWAASFLCPPNPAIPGTAIANYFGQTGAPATGFVSVVAGRATITGSSGGYTWNFTRDP